MINLKSQLKAAHQDLELLSQFISHDLRSPIRSIIGFSTFTLESVSKDLQDPIRQNLQRIIGAARHMELLMEGILKLVSLSGRELVLVDTDISKLCTAIIDSWGAREPTRKVKVHIAPNLNARCDESLATLLLENLIDNAWHFTRKSGEAEINIGHFVHPKGHAIFFIKDNGIGFDMSHAKNLFNPLERMHLGPEYRGIGLGLTIAKKIMDLHQGSIDFISAPQKGSTFYFKF